MDSGFLDSVVVGDALRDVGFVESALGTLRRFRSQPQVLTRGFVGSANGSRVQILSLRVVKNL